MAISVFDLFSIGIGPSSSHTVGPMRAARTFAQGLLDRGELDRVTRVRAELFGSLGATGRGHGTDRAIVLGLMGERPETVDPATVGERVAAAREAGTVNVLGKHTVALVKDDLVFNRRQSLPFHPNGMTFTAFDAGGEIISQRTFYSVGGGFVVDETATGADRIKADDTPLTYPFTTGVELLQRCEESGLPISGVMLANELAWRIGSRDQGRAAAHLGRDAGMRPGRLRGDRRAARRAEGAAPRARAARDLGRRSRIRPTRCGSWTGSICSRSP